MTIHDFNTSDGQEDASWWESFYRQAFPHYHHHTQNTDIPTQKRGVDHRVYLDGGTFVVVDAKVRSTKWSDVLLELWSDLEHQVPGWALKPMEATYIAYVFPSEATGWLIPFHLMQRALVRHLGKWHARAQNGQHGFRLVNAVNRDHRGGTYTTRSLAVPYETLIAAMAEPVDFKIDLKGRLDAA